MNMPNRSRIETSKSAPTTTESISARYSGSSLVRADQREAASIANSAAPATTSLKYSAKLSTTKPPPKNSPENPVAKSTADAANVAAAPSAARPAVIPLEAGLNTPTRSTTTVNPKATSSGSSPRKVPGVTVT